MDTIIKDRPKLTSNDYVTLESPKEFLSAMHLYSNIVNNVMDYSHVNDGIPENTGGSDEGDCFSDPGHSEEAIYACFEDKRFRIVSENTVK